MVCNTIEWNNWTKNKPKVPWLKVKHEHNMKSLKIYNEICNNSKILE